MSFVSGTRCPAAGLVAPGSAALLTSHAPEPRGEVRLTLDATGRLQPLLLANEDGGGSTALQAANGAFAAQRHDVQLHGIRGWGFVARPGGHELNALPPRAGNANQYLCAA